MYPHNFELFEFNKMWFVYGMSLFILFLWIAKSIYAKTIFIRRTPLDLFIILFLASQVISMLFSIDPYVSFWGYYSRFNGGILSFISYIFLYYAFATHILTKDDDQKKPSNPYVKKSIISLLTGGVVVALWGFPSHFGYDPTCLMFRGTLDVSCWTEAFQPKVRIFSTLGQPNWLAAYLSILIPITIAWMLKTFNFDNWTTGIKNWKFIVIFLSTILFYVDLLYTRSQSGFIGFWVGMVVFLILWIIASYPKINFEKTLKNKVFIYLLILVGIFLCLTFFIGSPIERLNNFTFSSLLKPAVKNDASKPATQAPVGSALEVGGTDSSKIRLIVWQGAVEIFKQNPILGTGPETFAFAYYKVRPAAHNLTSEWDYLYNKAHNEYLNYLATTGAIGFGTYLIFIGVVIWRGVKNVIKFGNDDREYLLLSSSLIGSFVTILVSNFFGFSVVILNFLLFIIPLWLLALTPKTRFSTLPKNAMEYEESKNAAGNYGTTTGRTTIVAIVAIIIIFFEAILYRYWAADQRFALGNNLNGVGQYAQANPELIEAVSLRPNEDLFKDELAVNLSTLAYLFSEQGQSTQAAQLSEQAKALSDLVIQNHPNNVVYWKSRTRILYSLSLIYKVYEKEAIAAIEKAHTLAPTDAKISYNMALMYDANGNKQKAVEVLRETTKLRPNYRDAYYAKALYLTELAKSSPYPLSQEYSKEARESLEYILKHIGGDDKQAKELLNSL